MKNDNDEITIQDIMISQDILRDLTIESIYSIPHNTDLGYISASEVVGDEHILRIYNYAYDATKKSYVVIKEMAGYIFPSRFFLDSLNESLKTDEEFLMSVMVNEYYELKLTGDCFVG